MSRHFFAEPVVILLERRVLNLDRGELLLSLDEGVLERREPALRVLCERPRGGELGRHRGARLGQAAQVNHPGEQNRGNNGRDDDERDCQWRQC